jgi:DNA-binding cell septation regulator SpoVG
VRNKRSKRRKSTAEVAISGADVDGRRGRESAGSKRFPASPLAIVPNPHSDPQIGPSPRLVESVVFVASHPADRAHGLLGWVTVTFANVLVIESIAIRQSRAGRHYVSFPAPKGRDGRPRELVRPLDQPARERLEREILAAAHHQIPDLVPPAPLVAAPRFAPGDSP